MQKMQKMKLNMHIFLYLVLFNYNILPQLGQNLLSNMSYNKDKDFFISHRIVDLRFNHQK